MEDIFELRNYEYGDVTFLEVINVQRHRPSHELFVHVEVYLYTYNVISRKVQYFWKVLKNKK